MAVKIIDLSQEVISKVLELLPTKDLESAISSCRCFHTTFQNDANLSKYFKLQHCIFRFVEAEELSGVQSKHFQETGLNKLDRLEGNWEMMKKLWLYFGASVGYQTDLTKLKKSERNQFLDAFYAVWRAVCYIADERAQTTFPVSCSVSHHGNHLAYAAQYKHVD